MSDCWRMSQWASARKGVKPGFEISAMTSALGRSSLVSSNLGVLPALTPATVRSPLSVRPKMLSNSIL